MTGERESERERETETERQTDRQTERERKWGGGRGLEAFIQSMMFAQYHWSSHGCGRYESSLKIRDFPEPVI